MARRIPPLAGLLVTRGLVPAWILTGAIFKLIEEDPGLLPRNTILPLGVNLGFGDVLEQWLAILIALECLVAAVIWCVPKLARLAAGLQMGIFCAVLIAEMASGNTKSCGCLGGFSPPPWAMLSIDGLLLLGVLLLPHPKPTERVLPRLGLAFGVALAAAAAVWAKLVLAA